MPAWGTRGIGKIGFEVAEGGVGWGGKGRMGGDLADLQGSSGEGEGRLHIILRRSIRSSWLSYIRTVYDMALGGFDAGQECRAVCTVLAPDLDSM